MKNNNPLPWSDRGVWLGAALGLGILVVGLICGGLVVQGIADHGAARLRAELEDARAERRIAQVGYQIELEGAPR